MNEVKTPKKNWFYYYTIVLLILIILNTFIMPLIQQHSVKEVDYGTFISMTEKKEIGKVEIESNQIVFTNKDESQIYKTGLMDDPNRTERLYESGAEFSSEIIEQMSPLVSFLLTWILPLVIFFALGQYMSKKLMNRMGGGKDSMMFGMGKSNAKIYVKSTEGIKFSDVAGEDEAKENLTEIVDYLHNPNKYKEIGASMPKGILLVGPPGTGKTMLAKTLAKSIDCDFGRVQFTPDLLPSDITGIHIYNQKSEDFVLKKGPVFANIILADEINRATPRTQSALLECMEEHQVTIDGDTLQLDEPFIVIATENPIETAGTYPLPEARPSPVSWSFARPESEFQSRRLRVFRQISGRAAPESPRFHPCFVGDPAAGGSLHTARRFRERAPDRAPDPRTRSFQHPVRLNPERP